MTAVTAEDRKSPPPLLLGAALPVTVLSVTDSDAPASTKTPPPDPAVVSPETVDPVIEALALGITKTPVPTLSLTVESANVSDPPETTIPPPADTATFFVTTTRERLNDASMFQMPPPVSADPFV